VRCVHVASQPVRGLAMEEPARKNLPSHDSALRASTNAMAEVSMQNTDHTAPVASFAQHAAALNGATFTTVRQVRPTPKPVIGKSVDNRSVKSVTTRKTVDIFISRLHPEMHYNELIDCVNMAKGDLIIQKVICTKLKSKLEHVYASFHVSVQVDSNLMKDV